MSQSNVERLFTAIINNDPTSVEDIIPRTNVEHFLKECVDKVDCGHCPAPLSRMDVLLETLRDKLINSGSGGKTEQHKTVNITANGTTEVLPDENKTLSGVTVNTSVVAESKLPQMVSNDTAFDLTAADLAGVTKIGEYAFFNSKLSGIEIPNNTTSIEKYAFANCTSLTSVTLPDSVTIIGTNAFDECTSLTSITIPDSVTNIGTYALRIGDSTNKATITMLRTTPPSIQSNTFNASYLNQIIVPVGCGDAYKTATNWATFADYIVEAAE